MLGIAHTLVAVDSAKNIYSPDVRKRILEYKVLEVAKGNQPNIELLLDIDPDCIMTSAIGTDTDVYPWLLEANMPVVVNGEWKLC